MVAIPLAHLSWAIADNADRKACDAFVIDTFGAETAFEMLITPESENMGLDREETLMLVGDTMLIPIAPAGAGARPDSPTGEMLRRSAGPNHASARLRSTTPGGRRKPRSPQSSDAARATVAIEALASSETG